MSGSGDGILTEALAALSLEEKVRLLTGRDFWTTWPMEHVGLRRMLLSDGPAGVRGETWDERRPSLNLPSPTALASSWDLDVARRYGATAAVEARRQDVDVVLGPTINLHRSPLNGRHFECFSEDPVLTADLAASYVTGVQENGVAATPKHYVANDSETDRFTVDVRVGERALRELYLLAFEKAVTEAGAWAVMSSYNSVNGTTLTEHDLLQTPLRDEWGFDGVVVSDWTAVRTLASARAEQDLAMPGPGGPWGDALVDAVRAGLVEEAAVDRKVLRILALARRVGALKGTDRVEPSWSGDPIAFAREAATEGTVLLTNRSREGGPELPWDAALLTSVAVVGDNAAQARTQGGGSATVIPAYTVSPLAGLRAALPEADITYSVGAIVRTGLTDLPLDRLTNPVTGEPGVRVAFLDREGVELYGEDRQRTAPLVWFGSGVPLAASSAVELTTTFTPRESGSVRLGFAIAGRGQLWIDDALVLDESLEPLGDDLGAAFLAPPSASCTTEAVADRGLLLRFRVDLDAPGLFAGDALSFQFGLVPATADPEALIEEAARAAAAADVALVVVGTSSVVESEGYDRTSLALPGRQDDLVRAVAAANPRTVVVVNAGAPVEMPWRDEVAAVLVGYFGGQEFGNAVADVLLGLSEPGGRLPTTWAARAQDAPILSTTPDGGVLDYAEGIDIGYRAWLRHGVPPAFWFGHGLSYSDLRLKSVLGPTRCRPGETMRVVVEVQNVGARAGKEVVQVYAERRDSVVDRPVRWLVGFQPVRLAAGGRARVVIDVPTRHLAHWADGWQYEPGDYRLRVGTSAVDLPLETIATLSGG